ncbi:PilZ domain-containing protein [Myxococcota bacterium]
MGYPENYPRIKQGVRLITSGPEDVQVTAVVNSVDEDGNIELGCLDSARAAALRTNLAVVLEYFHGGAVFKMRSAIVAVGPLPDTEDIKARRNVVVSAPRELKKIQRRRFTRVIVSVVVNYIKIDPIDEIDFESRAGRKQADRWEKDLQAEGLQGFTETLSGSGLRMRTDPSAQKGDNLYLWIELPSETVEAVGDVVWMGTPLPQEVPGEAVGVDFKSLTEGGRLAILEFVEGYKRK